MNALRFYYERVDGSFRHPRYLELKNIEKYGKRKKRENKNRADINFGISKASCVIVSHGRFSRF